MSALTSPPVEAENAGVSPIPGAPQRSLNLSVLLALSALLIVNSHLEAYYPRGFSFLAADGLLGNSMFYVLSGYGIQSSLQARRQRVDSFMLRRLVRIYPALWLAVGLAQGIIGGRFLTWTVKDYVANFIWPTEFTYVALIFFFYAGAYVLAAIRWRGATWLVLSVILAAYVVAFAREFPHLDPAARLSLGRNSYAVVAADYAADFVLGLLLARVPPTALRGGAGLAGGAALACAAYFALKFLMVVEAWHSNGYPVLHALVALICLLGFRALSDPALTRWTMALPVIGVVTGFIAAHTLEIYLIHSVLLEAAPLYRLWFPLNILALLAATAVCAPLARLATAPLRSAVDRRTLA